MANTPQRFLEKIREAKEKKLKELDLSGGNLIEIPDEVFELEWLEVLNLRHNQLRTLPEAIAKLQQLTTLDLGGNKLTTLPEAIASADIAVFQKYLHKRIASPHVTLQKPEIL